MKLIISQSQLKNITQHVISEQLQFSNPEDYTLKNILSRQKEAARPMNPGEGIYGKGKGWWSGTPLEKFMNDRGGLKSFENEPTEIVWMNIGNQDWNFGMDGSFETADNKNNYNTINTGTWKYDGSGHVIIKTNDGNSYNSALNKWMGVPNPNVNCASSLEEIKEGGIKILKNGCKTDAVKELQKLLGMEEKYQTGYFGSITKGKVKEFQTSNELKVDGIVGSKTYAALQQPKTPTDTSGLGVDDDIDQFNKFNMNEEKEIINENISNDIEEYRMISRRVSQQFEVFEEMVKKGDIRRANEEKEIVYKYIVRLINILMLLKVRLK